MSQGARHCRALLGRNTHDYISHSTTDLFDSQGIMAGTVIGDGLRRHRSLEFRHFLATVEQTTPPELDGVALVLGNSCIHETLLAALPPVRTAAFTPTTASWFNLVES